MIAKMGMRLEARGNFLIALLIDAPDCVFLQICRFVTRMGPKSMSASGALPGPRSQRLNAPDHASWPSHFQWLKPTPQTTLLTRVWLIGLGDPNVRSFSSESGSSVRSFSSESGGTVYQERIRKIGGVSYKARSRGRSTPDTLALWVCETPRR